MKIHVILSVSVLIAFAAMPIFAQSKPKIAVYVASDELKDNEKRMVGTKVLASFVQSGKFTAVERSDAFLNGIERERKKQRDGSVDDSQISRLGKEAGVQYVCVADLIDAFGIYSLSARLINTETAEIVGIGESEMKTLGELSNAADRVYDQIVGKSTAKTPVATPVPQPLPQPQPAVQESTWNQFTIYVEKPVAKPAEYKNFTKGQRWGTWALNAFTVPGLGSWVIMKDTFGGFMLMGLNLSALVALVDAVSNIEETEDCSNYNYNYYGSTSYCEYNYEEPDLTWFGVFYVSGVVWNIIRSATYNKPNKYAMLDPNNFQLAVVPSKKSNSLKPGLFYNARF